MWSAPMKPAACRVYSRSIASVSMPMACTRLESSLPERSKPKRVPVSSRLSTAAVSSESVVAWKAASRYSKAYAVLWCITDSCCGSLPGGPSHNSGLENGDGRIWWWESAMAEGHGADQLVQELRGEYHPHQAHVFAKSELPVADNGNAAGFLSPMLKDEQAVVHCMSAVPRWGPHTEYLALIIGRQSDPSFA